MSLFSDEKLNEYKQYLASRGVDVSGITFHAGSPSRGRWLRIDTGDTTERTVLTAYFTNSMRVAECYLQHISVKKIRVNPERDIVLDILDAFTPSIPKGRVKVIYRDGFWGWAGRLPSSPNAVLVGDKYYWRTFLSAYMDAAGNIQITHIDQGRPEPRDEYHNYSFGSHNGVYCNYVHLSQLVRLQDWRGRNLSVRLLQEIDTNHYTDTGQIGVSGLRIYRASADSHRADFHNYSTRIETVLPPEHLFCKTKNDLYAKSDTTPFLGFELESVFSGGQIRGASLAHDTLDKRVISKADGSLPSNGIEIVSAPGTLDFWKEMKLDTKLEILREEGFRSYIHPQCGFHIHVSRNALSVLDLFKIETFIHNPGNRVFLVLVAGRNENSYAKFTATRFNNRKKLRSASSQRGRRAVESNGYFGRLVLNSNLDDFSTDRRSFEDAMAALITDYTEGTISASTMGQYFTDFFIWSHVQTMLGIPRFAYLAGEYHGMLMSGRTTAPSQFIEWITPYCEQGFQRLRDRPLYSPEPISTLAESGYISLKAKYPTSRSESNFVAKCKEFSVGKTDLGRYDALNCANSNTVEFRMFKGTMCGQRVMSYLEFVEALVRFVQQVGTKEASSPEHFMRWLNSPFNRARYHNLCSYLIQSYPDFFALRNPTKFNETDA